MCNEELKLSDDNADADADKGSESEFELEFECVMDVVDRRRGAAFPSHLGPVGVFLCAK